MDYAWVALIALGVGLLGGYAGIAGAPFIIFALVTFLGYPQHSAQGTVLAMMMGPMTIMPVYYGRNIVSGRIKVILIAIATYMVFSFAGANIAYLFSTQTLKIVFGVVIVFVGAIYLDFSLRRSTGSSTIPREKPLSVVSMAIVGSIMGFVGGIVGIGAGILLIPYLTMVKGIEQREAQTMSLAILLPPVSLGAVLKYGLIENDIIWPAVGIIFAAYVVASGFGYKLSMKHKSMVLRIALAVLLIATGIVNIVMSTQA
ncbi:sulfite exporter TauE/SafE family protein [Chloroflexota bacterium]